MHPVGYSLKHVHTWAEENIGEDFKQLPGANTFTIQCHFVPYESNTHLKGIVIGNTLGAISKTRYESTEVLAWLDDDGVETGYIVEPKPYRKEVRYERISNVQIELQEPFSWLLETRDAEAIKRFDIFVRYCFLSQSSPQKCVPTAFKNHSQHLSEHFPGACKIVATGMEKRLRESARSIQEGTGMEGVQQSFSTTTTATTTTGNTYDFERFVDSLSQSSNTLSNGSSTASAPNSALEDFTYISIPSKELLEMHVKLALLLGIQDKKYDMGSQKFPEEDTKEIRLQTYDLERRLLAAEERVRQAEEDVMFWKGKHGAGENRRKRLEDKAQELHRQLMGTEERARKGEEEAMLWKGKHEALEKKIGDVIIL